MMAKAYQLGDGVPCDSKKQWYWHRTAAEKGYVPAQGDISVWQRMVSLYREQKEYDVSLQWALRAYECSEGKESETTHGIALAYLKLEKYPEALYWAKRSEKAGETASIRLINEVREAAESAAEQAWKADDSEAGRENLRKAILLEAKRFSLGTDDTKITGLPVEWLVLEADERGALAVCAETQGRKPVNDEFSPVCWEESDLFRWLNGSFAENMISEDSCPGKKSDSWWWLRTQGENRMCAAVVLENGRIDRKGKRVYVPAGAVRPVIRISFE